MLCPATRGFLYVPAVFGFLMILIILALNVVQSPMPLPLRSLPCDWRVSLRYCPWARGMKRQRAPLPQGTRGPGWPMQCGTAAPAQPSNHQAIFLSLEEGKCVDKVWKNHIFHPTPPASELWGNGCTSRGQGAPGGTGWLLRQVPCPSPGTPPGWASPPFSPIQASSRL